MFSSLGILEESYYFGVCRWCSLSMYIITKDTSHRINARTPTYGSLALNMIRDGSSVMAKRLAKRKPSALRR